MTILIKGGRVIDPSQNLDAVQDVLIENGKVSAVGGRQSADGAHIIDATGLIVMSGPD